MIQGDNLVGNHKLNDQSSISNDSVFDNTNNPEVVDINPSDPALLYAINSNELLRVESSELLKVEDDIFNDYHQLTDDCSYYYKQEMEEDTKSDDIEEPKNDVFPDLTEHDHAKLLFNIVMNDPPNYTKHNLCYSKELSKIFISLNKTFLFEIEHKSVDYDLYLRVMMVFCEEISSPVKRCQNHLFTEMGLMESERFSIIRTENPRAKYCGNEDGKNVEDRLSVLIPLSHVVPNEHNMARQSIALKFVCQNSCIGRKQTAVIFHLENGRGKILSKKVIKIKVCSCPKRDRAAEETKHSNSKRSADDAALFTPLVQQRSAKIPKILNDTNLLSPPMSSSSPNHSDDTNSSNNVSIKTEINNPESWLATLPDGSVNLNLNLPNKRMALDLINYAYNCTAGEMTRNPGNCDWVKFLEQFRMMQEK